ncbi:beta-ketoacyl synthase chain length factor [Acinetobacter soli]|uniref:beta-ketoacyl synthase chain length factor n=1 Tax=Acinetobacter soli TaxID=487316 RepID=UPI00125FDD18|nr:beta-ketoacyl synthase chain length factor [Acinetobacter soli]
MLQLHLSDLRICDAQPGLPLLEDIPVIQRRRLSALAKLALNVAIESRQQQQVDYIVWASRYGDEAKTLSILNDVLTGQTPSPTQFSTSVHNAIAGLYSILCKDETVSTSLSCSWTQAMIEVYAILKAQPEIQQVLLIYYEAALPDIYQEREDFKAFAVSTVLSLNQANIKLSSIEQTDQCDAMDFYHFWQDKNQSKLLGWQKCSI